MGSPFQRNVESWMDEHLYRKLGERPRTEMAWSCMRDLIGQQLLGLDFVPTPFLDFAAYYNQFFVFIKKENVSSMLRLRPPTYKVIGNLDYLVDRDLSTWYPELDLSPWDIADPHSIYQEYCLTIKSNQPGMEKIIEFEVCEVHARSIQPPIPGEVAIHRNLLHGKNLNSIIGNHLGLTLEYYGFCTPRTNLIGTSSLIWIQSHNRHSVHVEDYLELSGMKTIYVITDVMLARNVKLKVQVGNRSALFFNEKDMPIGFKYRKYKLGDDGIIIVELNTTLRIFENEAIWLRPYPQPIPGVSQWESMRSRKHSRRRKIRHNLTIPQPPNVSRVLNSQEARQGEILDEQRPFLDILAENVIVLPNLNHEQFMDLMRNRSMRRGRRNRRRVNVSVSMETMHGSH